MTSKLVQVEKTINLSLEDGREFTATFITDHNDLNMMHFDIFDDEGDLVNEDSLLGIEISEHLIEYYS